MTFQPGEKVKTPTGQEATVKQIDGNRVLVTYETHDPSYYAAATVETWFLADWLQPV